MSHKQEVMYKIFVYLDAYSDRTVCIGEERSYKKANEKLNRYLEENDNVSRAYIETCISFRNDKRRMWED